MENLKFSIATPVDAENASKLFCMEKSISWQEALQTFKDEFLLSSQESSNRIYYLAYLDNELLSFAGARKYEQSTDENMYGTSNLLPSGWYLRGLKVHPDWRRRGLGKEITLLRLKWLSERSDHSFVFLDDENKITVPMYYQLGFKEVSRGWEFSEPNRIAKGKKGLLLKKQF